MELFDGNLVEYAGSPDQLARLLDEHGLRLVGTYSGAKFIFTDILGQELWRIDRAASLATQWGAQHLVVGGGAQTLERWAPVTSTHAQ